MVGACGGCVWWCVWWLRVVVACGFVGLRPAGGARGGGVPKVPLAWLLGVAADVAEALAGLHRLGIAHGDISATRRAIGCASTCDSPHGATFFSFFSCSRYYFLLPTFFFVLLKMTFTEYMPRHVSPLSLSSLPADCPPPPPPTPATPARPSSPAPHKATCTPTTYWWTPERPRR